MCLKTHPNICLKFYPNICPKFCPKLCSKFCPKCCSKFCPKSCPKICPKNVCCCSLLLSKDFGQTSAKFRTVFRTLFRQSLARFRTTFRTCFRQNAFPLFEIEAVRLLSQFLTSFADIMSRILPRFARLLSEYLFVPENQRI